ncbi:glycosyltransferase family 2 protein [bacterium]|nr:MAG: glycosyltransferase family 2 protein [bacterium]
MTEPGRTEADQAVLGLFAVVILNWNGAEQVEQCVHAVMASHGIDPFFVIVDNGSTDGSDSSLASIVRRGTILKQERNVGVAAGFNVGVRWALHHGASYVLLLNSDAMVTPDCIREMKEVLDRMPGVGIVSPRILDAKNRDRIWFDGGFFNALGYPVHRRFGWKPNTDHCEYQEDFATGCIFLARADVYLSTGLFDETYFAYSEDVDLCMRATAHGWRIFHVPRAVARHAPSSSVLRNAGKWFRDYYVARNNLLLFRRQRPGTRWAGYLLYYGFVMMLIPAVYFLVTGQFRRVGAMYEGVRDFFRGEFGERKWAS